MRTNTGMTEEQLLEKLLLTFKQKISEFSDEQINEIEGILKGEIESRLDFNTAISDNS